MVYIDVSLLHEGASVLLQRHKELYELAKQTDTWTLLGMQPDTADSLAELVIGDIVKSIFVMDKVMDEEDPVWVLLLRIIPGFSNLWEENFNIDLVDKLTQHFLWHSLSL